MGKGRKYEHELATGLNNYSDGVRALTHGYSGNSSIDGDADIVVFKPNEQFPLVASVYFIEVKNYTAKRGNRVTIKGSRNDTVVDQLQELVDEAPDYVQSIFALKLDRCELALFEPETFIEEAKDRADGKDVDSNHPFEPRLTEGGNISVRKPETDEWPTAQSGEDAVDVIAEALRL